MSTGRILKVAGPLVIAEGMRDANMYDVVRVSEQRLIGEIIEMHGDQASIQVYEETGGLGPGEPVESTNAPLSVELGPGLIGSIYDGIQRPLNKIMEATNSNLLSRGVEVPALDREKKWQFEACVSAGEEVQAGDIIGTVQETAVVQQKIMIPYGVSGTLKEIKAGSFTIEDPIGTVETANGDVAVKRIPMVRRLSDDQSAASGLVADRRELSLVFALLDTVHVGYNLLFFNGERRDDMHPVVAEDAGGAGEIRFAVGQAIMVQQLAFRRETELLAPAAAVKRRDVAMLVHVPHGHFRHAEPQRRGEFRQVVHGRACQRDAVFMRRKPVVCIVIRADIVQRDAIFRRVQTIHFRIVEQDASFVPP